MGIVLLDGVLERAREDGTPPERLEISVTVTFELGEGIVRGALAVRVTVPGLDAAGFQAAAESAKANCPVSKALTGIPRSR